MKCQLNVHIHSLEKVTWLDELSPVTLEPFSDDSGPCESLPSSLLGIFHLFFTSSLLEYIVAQTNQYALECMGGEKFAKWTAVTVEELEAYMGFMILMGIVNLPALRDYWQKDEIFHYSPIARRISRDRFMELTRYLHFADNSSLAPPGTPGYDKLGKVRPVIERLSESFSSVYKPGRDVSIDEAMIPFKGRSSLKQYLPKKPVKRGIKVWALADGQNGYMSQFQVYTGKTGNTPETGLGGKVVMSLSEAYQNTFRHVYFDNFFTSPSLLIDLAKVGLYGCGTLSTKRKGFPPTLKETAKKGMKERGESKTTQYKNLTVSVWQDNKPVTIAATNSDPTTEECVNRRKRDGSRVTVKCPQSVVLYNKFMGGVDYNDQLRGYYHVRLKCRKSYKYIFWFLFDVAISNAHILARKYLGSKSTLKDARVLLAKGLIGDYCSRKRPGRPSLAPPSRRFHSDHFPMRKEKRSKCAYCYHHKKQRRDTDWYCNTCSVFLCHNGKDDDCYLCYHKHHSR